MDFVWFSAFKNNCIFECAGILTSDLKDRLNYLGCSDICSEGCQDVPFKKQTMFTQDPSVLHCSVCVSGFGVFVN